MTTRDDMTLDGKLADIEALEEAARVIKRRRVDPLGMSRAALIRVLLHETNAIRDEVRELKDRGSRNLYILQKHLDENTIPKGWPQNVCRNAFCGRWERNNGRYYWHLASEHDSVSEAEHDAD